MNNIISNRKYPLEERMVLFVYVIMIVSVLAMIVMNIVTGIPMVKNIKWLVLIAFIAAVAFIYIKKENMRRLLRDISFILIIFVVLPVFYITDGGLKTAAILYMIMLLLALIYSFSGKMRIFLLASHILIAQALMIVNYLFPDIFPYVSEKMMFLDWITSTPVILILISLLAMWVSREHHYEREKAVEFSEEMERISKSDTLTGIFNRRYLKERVEELDETDGNVCLFIFDIDRFKNINDTFGHTEGDRILIKTAKHMRDTFGEMTSIRFGGDEFLLIGSGCPPTDMHEKLKKFRKALINELDVTISGGVVKYNGNLEAALKRADELLYKAKEDGRNKVIIEV